MPTSDPIPRLALEIAGVAERDRTRATHAAELVLAEHGITLSRLLAYASPGAKIAARTHSRVEKAYALASAAATDVLRVAGVDAVQLAAARFVLIT